MYFSGDAGDNTAVRSGEYDKRQLHLHSRADICRGCAGVPSAADKGNAARKFFSFAPPVVLIYLGLMALCTLGAWDLRRPPQRIPA